MHRDVKEMLIGSATIVLFGILLIAWPPLAGYINAAVRAPIDLVTSRSR